MTYDRWQYRVSPHSLGGECRKCGGTYVGPKWDRTCFQCGFDPDEYVPVELDLEGWWREEANKAIRNQAITSKSWSPEIKAEAERLWMSGKSSKEVSAEVGVPSSTIRLWSVEWRKES